jgi:KDO2-lipid IV(A) lauroyltransferase
VRVSELGEALPSDGAAAAAVINRAMEALILQCPQQYLWGYHRYKQPRSTGTSASSSTPASAASATLGRDVS